MSNNTSMLEAARKYVSQGYSVVPIKKGEKRPAINWDDYQSRIPSDGELCSWFENTDNQIGIVTGNVSGGLFILDFDGENFEESFLEFLEKFPQFQDSLIIKTGSGKYHIYGKCPMLSATRWEKKYPNGRVELRANEHQTLCPPSVHPSGGYYEVFSGTTPVTISRPMLETFIKSWMNQGQVTHETKDVPFDKKPEGWEKELLEGVSEGERNNAITKLTGRYLGKGLSREEILPILLDANSRFNPPLDETEVESTLDSMIKTDEKKNPKKDDPSQNDKWDGKNLSEILDSPIIQPNYLVEPILSAGDKGFLVAQYKKGKTLLMMDLALCLSMRRDWLGFKVPKPKKVLYIRFELKDVRFQQRLRLMVDGMGGREKVQIIPHFQYPLGFELTKQEHFDWLKTQIDKHEPDALFLDPFYKITKVLDIKDPKNSGRLISKFDELKGAYPDLLTLISHHEKKSTGVDLDWDSTYGPMFNLADMDFAMKLTGKDKFTLSFLSNDVPVENIKIERDPTTLVHKFLGTESQDLRVKVIEILSEFGELPKSSTIEGVATIESILKDKKIKFSSDKLGEELSEGVTEERYRTCRIQLTRKDGRPYRTLGYKMNG